MDKIFNYLVEELKQSDRVAKRNADKLKKYEDIKNEFLEWINSNEFSDSGLSVDGYTAKNIHEMAPLTIRREAHIQHSPANTPIYSPHRNASQQIYSQRAGLHLPMPAKHP